MQRCHQNPINLRDREKAALRSESQPLLISLSCTENVTLGIKPVTAILDM